MTFTLLIVLILAGFVALGALAVQRRSRRARAIARGALVSYGAVVAMLATGEAYFRFVHYDTEGRLASDNWIARFWRDNSQGFRDREWTPTDWEGKTTVAIVGDSFTAGWGIENPADRFSDVLAERLGDDYAVFNLGVPGASTPEELITLQRSPDPTPDVVILQYFLNDTDYATLTQGLQGQPAYIAPLVRESFLANYLYSRFDSGFGQSYWAMEYAHYDHPAIWAVHEQEINAFVDYVDSIGTRLIVVIFPNLQDPVGSVAYVDRVAQVFEARGQREVLKLFDEAARWSPAEIVVSPRDGHPSVAFHHRVGDLIYEQFFAPP